MGRMLLWIEDLAVVLLLVAWVTAVAARRQRRRVQTGLPIVVAAVFFTGSLVAAIGAYWFRYIALCAPNLVLYTASWTIVFAIGAVLVIRRGLRTRDDGFAAKAWPAGRLGLMLLAAVALGLMTLWNMDLTAKNYLTAQRAEAGALALSVAPVRVPDRDNAALVYQRAFDALGPIDDDFQRKVKAEGPPRSDGEPAGPWGRLSRWLSSHPGGADVDLASPELREHLGQSAPVLALLRQAAAMPGCYFERDWGRPSIDFLLPEYRWLREAGRLLALEARCRAADGDAAGAVADLSAVCQMAGHTRGEPLLIGLLVAMSMDDTAASALEAVLATGQVKPADLAGLAFDDTVSYQRALARAFRMEEAFGLSCFAMLGETGDPGLLLDMMGGPRTWLMRPAVALWRVFLMPEDLAGYREALRTFQSQAALPYHEAGDRHQNLENLLGSGKVGVLTRMVVPALSRCAKMAARSDARHRLAQTALAVLAHRAKNGRTPEALSDLVPEFLPWVPLDPFDGRPLRLTTRDGKVVLYSVGQNRKDDGGTPWNDQEETGDLTFALPAD